MTRERGKMHKNINKNGTNARFSLYSKDLSS